MCFDWFTCTYFNASDNLIVHTLVTMCAICQALNRLIIFSFSLNSFFKQRFHFCYLACRRKTIKFYWLILLAWWIAVTGVPSLRILAKIWNILEALATSMLLIFFFFQLLLHFCVKQNPLTHFECAYNTLQWI